MLNFAKGAGAALLLVLLVAFVWRSLDKDRPLVGTFSAFPGPGSVLNAGSPGCKIFGPDGKPLKIEAEKPGPVTIPKGTTISSECFMVVGR